jgi:tetratricopeptide (TPR) repeat protein
MWTILPALAIAAFVGAGAMIPGDAPFKRTTGQFARCNCGIALAEICAATDPAAESVEQLLKDAADAETKGLIEKDTVKRKKLFNISLDIVREVLKRQPDSVEALSLGARVLGILAEGPDGLKLVQEALAMLDRAIGLAPKDASLHIDRGLMRIEAAGFECEERQLAGVADGVDDFTQAIALDPNSAMGYAVRGGVVTIWYDDEPRTRQSLEDLKKARQLDPDDQMVYSNMVSQYRKLHDWEHADETLTAAIAADPGNLYSYRYRAIVRAHLGNMDGAESDMAALAKLDEIEAAETRVRLWLDLKNQERAVEAANTMVVAFPDNAESYRTRADCYAAAEHWRGALSDIRHARDLNSSEFDTSGIITCLEKLRDFDGSIVELDEWAQRDKTIGKFYLISRASLNHQRGEDEAAFADLAEYERAYPCSSKVHELRGQILMSKGDLAKALGEFSRAIEMRSGFETEAESLVSRARLYIQQEKIAEAKQDLKRAVKIAPEDEDAKQLLDELSKGNP